MNVVGFERNLLRGLQRPEVVTARGEVLSWLNPKHAGYPYPEIAGYMLSLLAQEGEPTVQMRNRIADQLRGDISNHGGVGRGGVDYVFDSAMVLAGLLRHEAAGGTLPDALMPWRLHEFVTSRLNAKKGVENDVAGDQTHWSLSFGCHLLKTLLAIWAFHDIHPSEKARNLTAVLLDDLLPLENGGRFRVNALSGATYMHAHCYAVEGLLVLDGRGVASVRATIDRCADWLAEVQLPDGGVPAGYEDGRAAYVAHSDATSQAIRIWSCLNRRRYQASIVRGVRFLEQLVSHDGLRYRPGSEDVNTWATIFAVQALRWARTGGDWRWIV